MTVKVHLLCITWLSNFHRIDNESVELIFTQVLRRRHNFLFSGILPHADSESKTFTRVLLNSSCTTTRPLKAGVWCRGEETDGVLQCEVITAQGVITLRILKTRHAAFWKCAEMFSIIAHSRDTSTLSSNSQVLQTIINDPHTEKRRHWDMETLRHGGNETGRHWDWETRKHWNWETLRHVDNETLRQGNTETGRHWDWDM